VSVVATAYAAMSVLLVASCVALLYPAVTGVQVVVYRKAVLALGASALLFVVGWLLNDVTYHGFVDARALDVIASLIVTAAAATHLVAIWLFARDFLQFDAESLAIEVDGGDAEGFEDE
jgi:hypothetical protein